MSQISQAPPPISHSDHCHLSFNSNHLHLINTQLSQHYLSTHLTSVSCLISLTRSGLTPTLLSYLPQDNLPPVLVPRWSSVSPTSACLRPSPQLVFGVDPRCVLYHVIHEFLARKPSSVYPLSFQVLQDTHSPSFPAYPTAKILINITVLFSILCVWSTSRNKGRLIKTVQHRKHEFKAPVSQQVNRHI